MPLLKDEIRSRFKSRPLAKVEVLIPELDDTRDDGTVEPASVWVRTWTGTERGQYNTNSKRYNVGNITLLAAQMSLCDETGALLFTEADIPELGTWPSTAIERIAEASLKLNIVTPALIKELAKNSDETNGEARSLVYLDGSPRAQRNS
jgi:hypothetical protein